MPLAVKNLTIKIAGKTILENISAEFSPHKRTAIIGPNGAGKSTLLRALSLINSSYDGEIFLDGENIRSLGRKKLAQKLAILPQGMTAPPDTSVETLVGYGRFPYRGLFQKSDAKKDREAVEWALKETQTDTLRTRLVGTLSGGERQRAFIAMTLAQQPTTLLLDEPTTYLDIAHQLDVMEIIRRVNRDYGMTTIMVLHDINHALQYADEIMIIKGQKIFRQGDPQKILTVDTLETVFGVRADIFTNARGKTIIFPTAPAEKK